MTIHKKPFSIENNALTNCKFSITDLSGKIIVSGDVAGQQNKVIGISKYINQIVFVKVVNVLTGHHFSQKILINLLLDSTTTK